VETLWAFFSDPDNQRTLAMIGAGLAALAGGLWAVIKFFFPRSSGDKPAPSTSVTADRGGIAAGRDVNLADSPKKRRR
jgi:hypothetical protein